ncbi:MAG: disulfide bond formation protein B [Caulobacteraceae bacterium]|nr:disulfide bond formation protein B [Caulobacteraceae bacterium]
MARLDALGTAPGRAEPGSPLGILLTRWPIFAFALSAAMLAIAHGFQTFGGLAPCHLCLKQREVYWTALVPAGLGAALSPTPYGAASRRLVGAALVLVFGYGAYLAGFHAGAEWKWWPAPASCASTGVRVSVQDLQALLAGAGARAPACDEAPWRLLGLSMAGWNFLASLALVGFSAASALPCRRAP